MIKSFEEAKAHAKHEVHKAPHVAVTPDGQTYLCKDGEHLAKVMDLHEDIYVVKGGIEKEVEPNTDTEE